MKTLPPRQHRQAGVILLVAIGALAILTVLLLALFTSLSQQRRNAQLSAALGREKLLSDSAVALVEGQIAQASTQAGQTWISQPGLLRTYAATAVRAPSACYKLYSTPTLAAMTDTSGGVAFLAADIPATWSSQPQFYTDLNASVLATSGQTVHPILEPAAATAVQGVSIDSPHAVEMPVAWLYQLQDGTLGPASNATAANPIVARLAFWTDDETCQVNINTAGCGSPWNTPRVNDATDVAWSTMQPAQGEFSAYPGHPAQTSLAVIFGALSPQQLLGLSPRYAWGGSQFGSLATSPGESLAPKPDRLYASVDELQFGAGVDASGQRAANPLTASQIETARFVLCAHSVAPETTLLGEPRVAIWPVADNDANRTATDRAVVSAATVGTRDYFFQRGSPTSPLDDFDPASTSAAAVSNLQLFGDLVHRGADSLPGAASTFATKYPGAAWTQIQLEIADFIHALNAVDPAPAPFTPFAPGDATRLGRGFVVPLNFTYGTGAGAMTLRGLGRCPTLASLTLVFYVSGFGFNDNTSIDFGANGNADDFAGDTWKANFLPGSVTWKKVTSELVRAFVVPTTFQPGCGFPEVSDGCKIEIQGLDALTVTSGSKTGGFGFPPVMTSLPLGTPLATYPAERAWGGHEGPLAWTVTADAMAGGSTQAYAFAGTTAFTVPMTTTTQTSLDPKTGGVNWPPVSTLKFAGLSSVKVLITDLQGNTLQTLNVNLPAFSSLAPYAANAPTINGECNHADAVPPAASVSGWVTSAACAVQPSWYMSLAHRLQTSHASRAVMIQAGDLSRSVEAGDASASLTGAGMDLRVLGALENVPASMFQMHPDYQLNSTNGQHGTHAQNLRFADGTSACFAPGSSGSVTNPAFAENNLVVAAGYPATVSTLLTVGAWQGGGLPSASYNFFSSAPCSIATGSTGAYLATNVPGDWDTGPGFAPDGAQINLPDARTSLAPAVAYQSLSGGQVGAATQRTPNALVPSPVVFGSLPAGINPAQPASSTPWRTLLFCPYPAANLTAVPYAVHPGAASPPDHLVLDNFWMPVIEPYAISTCMATHGKVNLNDQIAPFTYLHRSTALRALLDGLRIPAIPFNNANSYKSTGLATSIWNTVDENDTVAQIENKFAAGSSDAYLSESEICTVPLVPNVTPSLAGSSVAATQANVSAFWASAGGGLLTGDNLRELPYAQLYGRLTTRSNSYTVHVRVQLLKKLPGDPHQEVWNEGVDQIVGDWRGSYEIERYLDPAAVAPAAGSPLGPYKFRIISRQQFAP